MWVKYLQDWVRVPWNSRCNSEHASSISIYEELVEYTIEVKEMEANDCHIEAEGYTQHTFSYP